jgi:peptide/nickel transport system substrate-binding protein
MIRLDKGELMMKKYFIFLIIALIACIFLTSCNNNTLDNLNKANTPKISKNIDDIMDKGPVKGGVLKLFSTKPDTLNPLLTHNIYVRDFSSLIFEGLFRLDKDQKAIPVLADKWDISKDGLTWTFHLKDNIFWHDNIPLTSDDVIFTLQTIQNTGLNSVYNNNIQNVIAYSPVDKSTFKLILSKPNSFMAEQLTFPIIAKHCFVGENIANSPKNMLPIGTGPYKFKSYNGKDSLKLVFYDKWQESKYYVKEKAGLPYISDINVVIYPDGKAAVNAFQEKAVDVALIPWNSTDRYIGRTDLVLKKYTSNNFEFITFNLSRYFLKNKNIRQAIAYAIDRQKIINEVLPGGAAISEIPVIPDTWLYNTNIITYTPSLSKAEELLSKSGLRSRYALNLQMIVNDDNETRYKVATRIQEQLARVGIGLQVVKLPWDQMQSRIKSKSYDIALLGCEVSSVPDMSFAYASNNIASGTNIAGYSNAQVDKYLSDIILENDSSRKKALFLNIKSIVTDEIPYFGLYFYDEGVVYNKRLKGNLNPYIWDRYNDLSQWYIPIR